MYKITLDRNYYDKLQTAVAVQIIDQTGPIFDKTSYVVTAFFLYSFHTIKIINLE